MKILKAKEMSALDRRTIEEIGIPSVVLMENAARGLLKAVEKHFSEAKRILVVAGKGNNGGDGLALARMLYLKGRKVDCYLALGEPKGDALLQLNILKNLNLEPLTKEPNLKDYDLIVDALFGTGFEPPIRGEVGELIKRMNESGVPILSIDIPSGLSANTGRVFKPSVRASVTVTFQFPKVCHVLFPAAKLCGEVLVVDISIPEDLAKGIKRSTIEVEDLLIPQRERDTYKNREGHVLIVGGSRGKTGAVMMSAMAATRTGSGLVTVGVPEELDPILEVNLVEEMSFPLPGKERLSYFCVEKILEEQERFSALAMGMGMDRYEEGQDIVRDLITGWGKPILLDADGINNLADLGNLDILKDREIPVVLTPHVGEFARLTGLSSLEIIENQIDVAQEFSLKNRCYVVLKAARTVITTPEGEAFVSMRGTPAMAKGGVGDVLSGVLISLIGRGMDIKEALKTGVFLHGLAGEIAEEKLHRECLRARDLIEAIPKAYKSIENFLKGSDTIR